MLGSSLPSLCQDVTRHAVGGRADLPCRGGTGAWIAFAVRSRLSRFEDSVTPIVCLPQSRTQDAGLFWYDGKGRRDFPRLLSYLRSGTKWMAVVLVSETARRLIGPASFGLAFASPAMKHETPTTTHTFILTPSCYHR